MRNWWKKVKNFFKGKKTTPIRAAQVTRDIEVGDLYPKAQFIPDLPKLKTRARMRNDYYVIHHTAGHRGQSGKAFVKNFLKRRLCTDFMDENGQIFIQRDHDRAGSHIGGAKVNGKSIRTSGIGGIEIASPGKLEKRGNRYFTWFNVEVPEANVRHATKEEGYNSTGYFEKFNEEQEKELRSYCVYLMKKHKGIKIVEHSYFSGYRGKTDLDGSLSMPLKDFIREKVMPLV